MHHRIRIFTWKFLSEQFYFKMKGPLWNRQSIFLGALTCLFFIAKCKGRAFNFFFGWYNILCSPLVTVLAVVVIADTVVVRVFFVFRCRCWQVRTIAQLSEDVCCHVVVCWWVGQLIFGAFTQNMFGFGRQTVHRFSSVATYTIDTDGMRTCLDNILWIVFYYIQVLWVLQFVIS